MTQIDSTNQQKKEEADLPALKIVFVKNKELRL